MVASHFPQDVGYLFRDAPPLDPYPGVPSYQEALEAEIMRQAKLRVAEEEAQIEMRLREALDTYFTEMHSAMWGRAFDLTQNRESAVAFIVDLYRNLGRIMLEQDQPE